MSEERRKILEMLSQGKINSDEAERLLDALNLNIDSQNTVNKKAKFFVVKVEKKGDQRHKNVDIKIPLALLKAGMKLKSLVPSKYNDKFNSHFSEHGVDFNLNDLNSDNIAAFIETLQENPITIDADNETVQISCV